MPSPPPLSAEARAKGGRRRQRQIRLGRPVRVVEAREVPGGRAPETLDDIIKWAAWLSFAAVTGTLDPSSVREANRSLSTLKVALEKKDLLDRIRGLEGELKAYKQKAVTR